jgi:hypothetical protein
VCVWAWKLACALVLVKCAWVTRKPQVIQATSLVLEEIMIKDLLMHPMQIVGWEGILSGIWMLLFALPLAWVLPGFDVGAWWDLSVCLRAPAGVGAARL